MIVSSVLHWHLMCFTYYMLLQMLAPSPNLELFKCSMYFLEYIYIFLQDFYKLDELAVAVRTISVFENWSTQVQLQTL